MSVNKDVIILTEYQIDILTGLMLGDGCIRYSSGRQYSPMLFASRAFRDHDYSNWLFNQLRPLCQRSPYFDSIFDKRTNKSYTKSVLYSLSSKCLIPFREKWYPNNIKIVDRNLVLTPIILLIWFLDDGSVSSRKNVNETRLKLSTHGFTKSDVQFLIELLSNRYNSIFTSYQDDGNYFIYASGKGAKLFLSEIESIWPDHLMMRKKTWKDLHKVSEYEGHYLNKLKYKYIIYKYIIDNKTDIFNRKALLQINKNITGSINQLCQSGFLIKSLSPNSYNGLEYQYQLTDLGKQDMQSFNIIENKLKQMQLI